MKMIDVSQYQGNINWSTVKNCGVQVAVCKASQGTGWIDPNFIKNWQGMKANGIARGAYHFADPKNSAASQANHFWNTVKVQGFDTYSDTLALDLETDGGSVAWAKEFLTALSGLVPQGTRIEFYSFSGYINSTLDGGVGLGSYPLWLANYQSNEPACPKGWDQITIWQNSDTGHVAGIVGNVDTDVIEVSTDINGQFVHGTPSVPTKPKEVASALNGSMTGVWIVAEDGGVFTYGKAAFHGSLGGKKLDFPIVDILAHGDGGYYLLAKDGGVITFGDAPFKGSYPGLPAEARQGNRSFLSIVDNALGGYSLLGDDGSHYEFH